MTSSWHLWDTLARTPEEITLMYRRRAHASGALLFILLMLRFPAPGFCTPIEDTTVPDLGARTLEQQLEQAHALLESGELAAADSLARLIVDASEDSSGDPLLRARALDALVAVLIQTSNATDPEPLELAQQAVAFKEGLDDPPAGELATSLVQLSILQRQRGKLDEVQPLLERALELRSRETPPDSLAIATVHNELGTLYTDLDRFDLAVEHFRLSLRITESQLGPDDPGLARKYNHYGRMLYQDARYDDALAAQYRALEILEANHGEDFYANAYILNQIANAEEEMGRYVVAGDCYRRALTIALKEYGEEHMLSASLRMNQGRLKLAMGNYSGALETFEASLPNTKASWGETHRYVAVVLGGLSDTYRALGELENAESYGLQSIGAFELALDAEHSHIVERWYYLAIIYHEMGRYDEALDWQRRALEQRIEVSGPQNLYVAQSRHRLGQTLNAIGDSEAALVELDAASEIFREQVGARHPSYATTLADHAVSLYSLGRLDESLALAIESESVLREHATMIFQSLPEREALAFAARELAPSHDLLVTLAFEIDDPSLVWDALMRSRAGVLDAMARRQRDLHLTDNPEHRQLADEYAAAAERYARLLVAGPSDELAKWTEIRDAALLERDEAERALAVATGRSLPDNASGLVELREALPTDTALVGCFRFESLTRDREPSELDRGFAVEYMAFVMPSRESPVRAIRLGAATTLDQRVHDWMDEARRGASAAVSDQEASSRYRTVATELREAVWDPLTEAIGDTRRVLIAPEGELHRLHLAALPIGDDAYLADSGWVFHSLSRELDLVRPAEPEISNGVLLALGNPEFDREPTAILASDSVFRGETANCPEFRSLRFHRLPASAQEVAELSGLWKQIRGTKAHELQGRDATEAALKESVRGCEVLHLATHGFVIAENCAAVPGTRGFGAAVYEEPQFPAEMANPLQLSGLAFAGANRRAEAGPELEDGILTAQEIATLDLGGVRWAVLSACDTGGGEIQSGEGVFGLRRAFEIAGAQSLIMSLWPVRDEIAREWMVELYRARLETEATTIDAVNSASATLLARRRAAGGSTHPALWGAFVACGDWR